ncbi:Probable integral membrane protein Cj1452 [hydrothermal vent metagenome]|uniref:Probable integral membrane protein Cj1452 n=1 Tax=hydrothermal vent metagenome TaxID=652676 RepID=A0A1W1BAX5_9ZZZZ
MQLFIQSLKDLFTPKMLKFSLVPLLVIAVVMYVAFLMAVGAGIDQFQAHMETTQTVVQNGVPHTQTQVVDADLNTTSAIGNFIATYIVGSWLFSFFVYAIGTFFVLYASIFMAVIVIGFLTPYILKELQQMHYQDVEFIGFGNMVESLLLTLKWLFVMLLLFFLFVPLYFIPVVNVIALNFPLYYFFHKMMNYDVGSTIATREEYAIITQLYSGELRIKTLVLYLLSLVPFVILFATVFYVIYLGHTYFIKVRELRLKKKEE